MGEENREKSVTAVEYSQNKISRNLDISQGNNKKNVAFWDVMPCSLFEI
jgi:hypothetical protein